MTAMTTTTVGAMTIATPSDREIVISRAFDAPRALVFDCHTKPELVCRWLLGPPGWSMPVCDIDLRVGGKYRIEMKHSGGNVHTAYGEYVEIVEPRKLVYTWSWEDGFVKDTLVTVEFREDGGGTELVLTHERFPDAEAMGKHSEGWKGCVGQLQALLAE
jgi:uncharacterized protein YndB with AHSA1/START domain